MATIFATSAIGIGALVKFCCVVVAVGMIYVLISMFMSSDV